MNSERVVPVRGVVLLEQMTGDDEEDLRLLKIMAAGAQSYIQSFSCCRNILEAYFGDGYGGIVAVFLFKIEPSRQGVDEWLWVVFGDVPPASLVIDVSKTPSQALEGYVREMSRWVELAKQGRSATDVIPVYVPATPENATDIETRLKLLREFVIPAFQESEAVRA